MKIMLRNLTEQFLSNLNKLPLEMGKLKSVPSIKKSSSADHQIFSWHRARPKIFDIFPVHLEDMTIDLSLLEKFESSFYPQDISYQSVLASYLQHQSLNAQKAEAMKDALAVRKMGALVRTTVQEMRMIELRYSSCHKG